MFQELWSEPALMSTGPWQGSEGSGGGQGTKSPEAESILYFACPKEAAILPHYWKRKV